MKQLFPLFVITLCLLYACGTSNPIPKNYESPLLKIEQLTPNAYIQISYLDIPNYGFFPCNGLIFIDGKEAIVFDTPTNDSASLELIEWIEKEKGASIKAIVVNHFHVDCLGGLQAFHDHGIPSYANQLTIELAKADSSIIPQNGFDQRMELTIGESQIINEYFGEGHSKDNIVSYIPREQMLFGGCMIKEVDASKGNLNDANVEEWPKTVERIQQRYPDLKYVIPGHGKTGGTELLDYTITLFNKK